MLPWSQLKNPVYAREGWSVKDACMAWHRGSLYLFVSAFFESRGRERSHVVGVTTPDLQTFSDPFFLWSGEDDGWTGLCSPNLSTVGNKYVLTLNSWGEAHPNGQPNQLLYSSSTDLEEWSPLQALASDLTRGQRAIDAALTEAYDSLYLVWKEQQTPQLAVAKQLGGPWRRLGRPTSGWFENAQGIQIDDAWQLLVTGPDHLPYLMKMKSSGIDPSHWLEWEEPRRLEIPEETFNTNNQANAAFLADWRDRDGYFYLLYAGRTEDRSHAGRGNNKLGLARSKDLHTWHVPR